MVIGHYMSEEKGWEQKKKKDFPDTGWGGAGGGGPRRGSNRDRGVHEGADVRPSNSYTTVVVRAVSVA